MQTIGKYTKAVNCRHPTVLSKTRQGLHSTADNVRARKQFTWWKTAEEITDFSRTERI